MCLVLALDVSALHGLDWAVRLMQIELHFLTEIFVGRPLPKLCGEDILVRVAKRSSSLCSFIKSLFRIDLWCKQPKLLTNFFFGSLLRFWTELNKVLLGSFGLWFIKDLSCLRSTRVWLDWSSFEIGLPHIKLKLVTFLYQAWSITHSAHLLCLRLSTTFPVLVGSIIST